MDWMNIIEGIIGIATKTEEEKKREERRDAIMLRVIGLAILFLIVLLAMGASGVDLAKWSPMFFGWMD